VIAQLSILLATQALPMLRRTWRARDEAAVIRSARLAYGSDFSDYVSFLRQTIPEESLVVLPSPEVDPVLGEMPFMQYFLFPRQLTNCADLAGWAECVVHYTGPHTYLIAVDSFPPREGLEGRLLLPFDESRGIVLPAGGAVP
jgi:hypothetical protein